MKILKAIIFAAAAALCYAVFAQAPENVKFEKAESPSMKKKIDVAVILPEDYAKNPGKRYPAVYLLHGYKGSHATWPMHTKPNLHKLATRYQMIFVSPDGGNNWYFDSPKNPEIKYETFVSKELVDFVDSKYRTIADKSGRAITGFSMGGHGALFLCFRHGGVFGACGSTSGAADMRPFPNTANIAEIIGGCPQNPKLWDEYMAVEQISKIDKSDMPAIIVDCGTEDFLFAVNEALHKRLLEARVPHEYTTRPGAHTHDYWRYSIDHHLIFFDKFFKSKKQ